jgi:hypothetical protein
MWINILMAGSLILLAGFEYVWLQSTYTQERELLEERQTQRLHEAVRSLEDKAATSTAYSFFQELFLVSIYATKKRIVI